MNAKTNNTPQYDLVTFLGRLEPPHVGHIETLLNAFNHGRKVLMVLGSHNEPRTIKNPFTTQERMEMVLASLPLDLQQRIVFVGAEDYLYSDSDWFTNVSRLIREVAFANFDSDESVAIMALNKDESTYYLDYFKESFDILPMHEIKVGDDHSHALSATKIRELYLEGYVKFIEPAVTPGTYDFLVKFMKTPEYAALRFEYDEGIKYDKQFENAPYGNTNFLTSDAVVFQSGHVLLVQRGHSPGKGLWAVPGGHLNNNERFLEGAIRELREETGLKVPEKVLRGSVFAENVFDHPNRSLRCRIKARKGRTVTMAFGFKLDDKEKLPRVTGQDDAALARWIPIDVVLNEMRSELFEDHWHIIKWFANRL
ncbi:bifunctional nicotinamide mononucleotide adenylyltransferase/ADP-ribose pyrophosphatase [Xanthomonas phage XacN1]|nr:bifunctional nicotinamide mononucleotide adenylyltransferase/ADP-ribose pyrophosphatase [Xanthomonas phage XacN1]